MSERGANLPPEQEAIRAKCFHPSGTFVEFPIEDVETSIPARFEKIVQMYPDRIAVKQNSKIVTYSELNRMANRLACSLINECDGNAQPVGLIGERTISDVRLAAVFGYRIPRGGGACTAATICRPEAIWHSVARNVPRTIDMI